MTKQELLDKLTAQVVRVMKVEEEIREPGDSKIDANIRTYSVHVMQQQGGDEAAVGKVAFYTVDEGTAQERALWLRKVQRPANQYADAVAYLRAQGFVRFRSEEEHPDHGYAIMRVWTDQGNGTVAEQRVLLYYDAQGNPAHSLIG